ncbi:MAG: hypothetical protein Q9202_005060 [Teloschistes flavicans]
MTDITTIIQSLVDFHIQHPKIHRIRLYDGSAALHAPFPTVVATDTPQTRALRYKRPPSWQKPRLTHHLQLAPPSRPPSLQYIYTAREITHQFSLPDTHRPGTLNPDPTGQHLAFVLVYKDQHYTWPSAPWIHCKTNLHLLSSPSPSTATSAATSSPIPHPYAPNTDDLTYEPATPTHPFALFTQDDLPASCLTYPESAKRPFQFRGWWRVGRVLYVKGGSGLVKGLLERKFQAMREGEGRKAKTETWEKGVECRWACVELVPWEGADRERGNPMVPLKFTMEKLSEQERRLEEEVARLMEKDGEDC